MTNAEFDAEDKVTGEFVDIAKVTDPGTAEEEEEFLVRLESGEVNPNKATQETSEWQPASSRYEIDEEGHVRWEVEISGYLPAADTDYETLGVYDEDGTEQFNNRWDAIRLYVFENAEDDEPALEREGVKPRWQLNEENFDDGPATFTASASLGGGWHTQISEDDGAE